MANAEQIREHYDTPAALFELFLDPTHRSYSAGRWQRGDTLEHAQLHNLTAISEELGLSSETSVLDIGCGWGAFTDHCMRHVGSQNYVGLTPSPVQIAYIRDRLKAEQSNKGAPFPRLEQTTWQNFARSPEQFDALVSLESSEHIASYQSRRNGKAIHEYETFFESCAKLSTPSAPLYLQASLVHRLPRNRSEMRDWNFILKEVFRGSALPDHDLLLKASARTHEPRSITWGTEDYLKTLEAWRVRLLMNEESFTHQFGAERFGFFDRYLTSCIRLFDSGVVSLVRIMFERKASH